LVFTSSGLGPEAFSTSKPCRNEAARNTGLSG
jgi:hypothetical protein